MSPDVKMEEAGSGDRTGDDDFTSSTFQVKPDPDQESTSTGAAATISSSPPSEKSKAAPKKKGTASNSKKGTKPKIPKSKAPKKRTLSTAGNKSSDDETDNGPYCLCRGPDDHRWMIGCDVCEDWFHGDCVGLSKETGEKLVERFVCPNCTDGKLNYTKYKKQCSFPGCKIAARLYDRTADISERSVFCSQEHVDAWWISMINTLPTKTASDKAIAMLTQEDFMGLLASTATAGGEGAAGWSLGDKPFGNIEGLWAPKTGLPTRPGVLSDEEQAFLQGSAAERLALGNEIVQYKKMMQLIDWANERRQAAVDAGRFTKDSCGYDRRLDTVSVRPQFSTWLDSPEGQATFKAGKLEAPGAAVGISENDGGDTSMKDEPEEDAVTGGMCEKKRCKPHGGWNKLLMSAVRVLVKEAADRAADKLEAEDVMRREAETRYERLQLENSWVKVLEEDE